MAWIPTVTFDGLSTYNALDLNRENGDAEYLFNILKQLGNGVQFTYPIVKNRGRSNFPTVSAINQIRQNIKDLVNSLPEIKAKIETVGPVTGTFYSGEESLVSGAASVPAIVVNLNRKQTFDFDDANALEMTLQLIYDYLVVIIDNLRFSGTFYSGEEGLIY